MNTNWVGLWTFTRREIERFLRVWMQSLATPWISALLYILIFGKIVGVRIGEIQGVPYIDFVLPGILTMNVIMAAFGQSSNSLYFQRFVRHIEEVLVSPLSYAEMIVGYVAGSLVRASITAAGIYVLAVFFGAANFAHPALFFAYVISVSILFSLLGLLVGLWADGFERLTIILTFIITPLSYLGGMFNSISMLPPLFQTVIRFNPFFYFIDGIRYSMIGVREANALAGFVVIVGSVTILGVFVWHLFKRGWRLRA